MFGHTYGQNKAEVVTKLLLKRLGINIYDVNIYVREDSNTQLIHLKKMRFTDSRSLPLSYVQILRNYGIEADFKTESYVGDSNFQPTIFIYASVDKIYKCLSSKTDLNNFSEQNICASGKDKSKLAKKLLLNLIGADESNVDIYCNNSSSQYIYLKKMRYTDSWAQPKSYMQLLKNYGIDADFKTESYVGTSTWQPTLCIRATEDEIINKLLTQNNRCEAMGSRLIM